MTHPLLVPILRGLHDPAELANYGLPAGTWAYVIEIDPADLIAMTGRDWDGFEVIVIGVENWSPDPDNIWPAHETGKSATIEPLGAPLDIARVEVRLRGSSSSLVREWGRDKRTSLTAYHLEGLKRPDIQRLLRGVSLSDLDWHSLGRPSGSTAMTAEEFETAARRHLSEMRRDLRIITRPLLAERIAINQNTLSAYLRRAKATWGQVLRGTWPPT